MFYENLELLREKHPLFAFAVGQQEYPEIEEAEVYFFYNVETIPSEFLERGAEVCLLFSSPAAALPFLCSAAATPFLSSPKVNVYWLKEEEEYKKVGWRYLFLKRVHVEPYERGMQSRVENMLKSIELVASDYRNFGIDILRNVYNNLLAGEKIIFVSDLKGKFSKQPVVVCGAGPSLQEYLPILRELQHQVMIVGCGSAIPILMQAGVRPHMAAFIDPDPPLEPFRALTDFTMPLLYQNRISRDIFRLHKGPKIWVGNSGGYAISEWLESQLGFPHYFIDGGWNVANFAMQALVELGASQIHFVGIDCSYPKEVPAPHEWTLSPGTVTRKDLFMGGEWMKSFAKQHPLRPLGQTLVKGEKWGFGDLPYHVIDQEECLRHISSLQESLARARDLIQEGINIQVLALVDVEIQEEISYSLLLEPLWNVWKHILRTEELLHKVLFFQRVIDTHQIRIYRNHAGGLYALKEGGVHQYFYPDGALRLEEQYKEGRLHGVQRLFSPEGKLLRETHYQEGKREGKHTIYGVEEGSFAADLPTGVHRLFFPGGALAEEISYHDSDRFDKKIFQKDGTLVYEGVYDQDLVYTETKRDEQGNTTVRKGKWVQKQLIWHS